MKTDLKSLNNFVNPANLIQVWYTWIKIRIPEICKKYKKFENRQHSLLRECCRYIFISSLSYVFWVYR